MDAETTKLIKEQYAKLPPALQKAIQSTGLHDQITAIGTKHQLHIDQMGLLEDEISLLMMGFTDPIEFAGALQEHVHVTAEQAQKIAVDVNQEILLPIRDRMESNTTDVETPSRITNPPAVNTPPIIPGKSVVMPSAVAAAKAAAPVSSPAVLASTDMQINAPEAQDTLAAPMHEAEVMFNEPTVSIPPKVVASAPAPTATPVAPAASANPSVTAKVEPPKPAPIYKADPYREPIE